VGVHETGEKRHIGRQSKSTARDTELLDERGERKKGGHLGGGGTFWRIKKATVRNGSPAGVGGLVATKRAGRRLDINPGGEVKNGGWNARRRATVEEKGVRQSSLGLMQGPQVGNRKSWEQGTGGVIKKSRGVKVGRGRKAAAPKGTAGPVCVCPGDETTGQNRGTPGAEQKKKPNTKKKPHTRDLRGRTQRLKKALPNDSRSRIPKRKRGETRMIVRGKLNVPERGQKVHLFRHGPLIWRGEKKEGLQTGKKNKGGSTEIPAGEKQPAPLLLAAGLKRVKQINRCGGRLKNKTYAVPREKVPTLSTEGGRAQGTSTIGQGWRGQGS